MTLYGLLLHLFPASFRVEYGEEMRRVFDARRREENPLALWIATIFDVVTNALRVHAELLRQDLAWTLRLLRQSPGFTITAVSVAALGMGASTAAFTLLDHVLLRPLPFPHPEQLVMLYQNEAAKGYPRITASPPNYEDWRALSGSFSSMGASIGPLPGNLSGQGDPLRVDYAMVNSDVFTTLGVGPAAGRGFTAEDDRDGASSVALLSEHLAFTQFGGAAGSVGRTVHLENQVYTIIGVMPAGFAFPSRGADLWIPIRGMTPESWAKRTNHLLGLVARLRPGVSVKQARADMDLIAGQLERAYSNDNAGVGIAVLEMREIITPQSRMLVLAVFGAAFCVLLIGCTNLASLLLARSMVRRHELAVRIAIGAARERLIRQLLTENLVLATAGAVFGLALAAIATPLLGRLVPNVLPIGSTPEMDLRVFAFAAALTLLTGIAFGMGPALRGHFPQPVT